MSKKVQQNTVLVKRKGRLRAPTSILVFELDDNSVDYLLGDNIGKLAKSLYEKMRAGCKLLFISKQEPILKKLQENIGFNVETNLIKDKTHNKMKDEVIKMVLKHNTDKIIPQASVYIGTLFDQEELNSQKFKFGTVTTPSVYFNSLLYAQTSKMKEEHPVDSNNITPDKVEDVEFDNKDHNSFYDSEPSSVKQRPFGKISLKDELAYSDYNTSSHKKSFMLNEQNNQQQDSLSPEKHSQYLEDDFQKQQCQQTHMEVELPLLYYSKIKDLNNRISCKLCLKLDELKSNQSSVDQEKDIKSPRSSPPSPLPEAEEPFSQLGKRKRNFEEDMFNEYMTNMATELKSTDDGIFNSSRQMNVKNNTELVKKLQNLNFEVLNEADARPIMKKLKTNDDSKSKGEQKSNGNELILEYKVSLPGERSTTIQVHTRDIQKLEPNCDINDTLIQFYLKLIQSEFLTPDQRNMFYVYNTYLIEKLKGGNKREKEKDFEKIYNSVKKWTKDVDIFNKEFLLFPMHDKVQNHWSLFIVCYPKYFLVKLEPTTHKVPKSKKPFILYFDSLRGMDTHVAKLIAQYLEYEVMHKKPDIYNEIKSGFNSITEDRIHQVIVPLQDNNHDCGLYLLEYAERFMTNPSKILENIEVNRDKLYLFPKTIFKSKRTDIANLILSLAKGNKEALIEYQKNKEERLQAAEEESSEFEEISDENFEEYLQNEFGIDKLDNYDAGTQDRLKMNYFCQRHDQKLAGTVENSNMV